MIKRKLKERDKVRLEEMVESIRIFPTEKNLNRYTDYLDTLQSKRYEIKKYREAETKLYNFLII